jgi:hypothetical protein
MRSESVHITAHKDSVRLIVRDGDNRTVASILLDQAEALELMEHLDAAQSRARDYGNEFD